MTLYLDSSGLVKRYVEEPQTREAAAIMGTDSAWLTANHTYVEVALALHRRLEGKALRIAKADFERDWQRLLVVALDDALCRRAAEIGVQTVTRSLDAMHLAAAERGGHGLSFLTFDLRLADAARSLGFAVVGP